MVYAMRSGSDHYQVVDDLHVCGLFWEDDWLRLMAQVGFKPFTRSFEHSEIEPDSASVFLGLKATV